MMMTLDNFIIDPLLTILIESKADQNDECGVVAKPTYHVLFISDGDTGLVYEAGFEEFGRKTALELFDFEELFVHGYCSTTQLGQSPPVELL